MTEILSLRRIALMVDLGQFAFQEAQIWAKNAKEYGIQREMKILQISIKFASLDKEETSFRASLHIEGKYVQQMSKLRKIFWTILKIFTGITVKTFGLLITYSGLLSLIKLEKIFANLLFNLKYRYSQTFLQ